MTGSVRNFVGKNFETLFSVRLESFFLFLLSVCGRHHNVCVCDVTTVCRLRFDFLFSLSLLSHSEFALRANRIM